MSVQEADERERLMATSRDWAAATVAGDLRTRARAYWTDDAIVLPPRSTRGRRQGGDSRVSLSMRPQLPGFSITWQPELAVVADGGDMALHDRAEPDHFHRSDRCEPDPIREGGDDLAEATRWCLALCGRYVEQQSTSKRDE